MWFAEHTFILDGKEVFVLPHFSRTLFLSEFLIRVQNMCHSALPELQQFLILEANEICVCISSFMPMVLLQQERQMKRHIESNEIYNYVFIL